MLNKALHNRATPPLYLLFLRCWNPGKHRATEPHPSPTLLPWKQLPAGQFLPSQLPESQTA